MALTTVIGHAEGLEIRAPEFWPEKPELWFAQMEAIFSIRNITSDSFKFNFIISQMGSQYVAEIEDVILSQHPPEVFKYDKLKYEVIKRMPAVVETKINKVLMSEKLGDRKPSEFLKHLQQLAGPYAPEDVLKKNWTSRLPTIAQEVIALVSTSPLEVLARIADVLHGLVAPTQVVAKPEYRR